MMTTLISALMSIVATAVDPPPFEKFVVTDDGAYVAHISNTWWNTDGHRLVVTTEAEPATAVHTYAPHAAAVRESGPLMWGVVDGAMYDGGYLAKVFGGGYDMVNVNIGARRIETSIAREIARREGADRAERYARWEQMTEYSRRYGFVVTPLNDYIIARAGRDAMNRGEATLAENWNLSFDAIYRSLDDIAVVAAHEGNLLVWELDRTQDPGNTEWTTREPVPTDLDDHFRIFRAGEQLYLLDTEGVIYAGIGKNHHPIGTVQNWDGDTPVIVLENQHDDRIGFLRVNTADEMTVLGVDWADASFADDFLTEITSTDLSEAIVRMNELMRDDAPWVE